MTQPRGGHGPRKSRMCYRCSKKRSTYFFDCRSKVITRVTGLSTSPLTRTPLCQQCACDVFSADVIESAIASGRLSWKSQRPPQQPQSEQLTLTQTAEEQL